MPTEKNAAPIQKEEPVLSRANEEERGPNPKGGTDLHKVMGWWFLEKVKVKVEALVELLKLWWFEWR